MRLLLATKNPGKLAQIKSELVGIPCEIVSPQDVDLENVDVNETGKTLEENARLKARGFFEAARAKGYTDIAVLSDDGGFEIDALNGEPGVYARRWAGDHATDAEIIAYALNRMEGIPREKRTARFRVFEALIFPDGREHVAIGSTDGFVTEELTVNKTPGFPYDALLIATPFGKRYDELTPEEYSTTHRALALREIRDIILQYLSVRSS